MMKGRNIIYLLSGASFVLNCPSEAFWDLKWPVRNNIMNKDNTGHFVSLSNRLGQKLV